MNSASSLNSRPSRFGGWAFFAFLAASAPVGAAEPTIHIVELKHGKPLVVEVTGVAADDLAKLQSAKGVEWSDLLRVAVKGGSANLLGDYSVTKTAIRFQSRFAPAPGLTILIVFDPRNLPSSPHTPPIRTEATAPAQVAKATTQLVHIYPSADELPENQLRFYLHFSAPMSRGEAYSHLKLVDGDGKEVTGAFLELPEELWDSEGKRFTLLLHPGRIKRGLKPREELGPILEEGKKYTLLVAADWPDAEGNPLKLECRKRFTAGPPREKQLILDDWKVHVPKADTKAPLEVQFPYPLDQALLERLLWIVGKDGQRIAGAIRVTDKETKWTFTPTNSWKAGRYHLTIETTLEDTAGNSIARPFELDLVQPRPHESAKQVTLSFEIRP